MEIPTKSKNTFMKGNWIKFWIMKERQTKDTFCNKKGEFKIKFGSGMRNTMTNFLISEQDQLYLGVLHKLHFCCWSELLCFLRTKTDSERVKLFLSQMRKTDSDSQNTERSWLNLKTEGKIENVCTSLVHARWFVRWCELWRWFVVMKMICESDDRFVLDFQ